MKQAGDFLPGPGLFPSFSLQGLIDPVLLPSVSSSSSRLRLLALDRPIDSVSLFLSPLPVPAVPWALSR
jgi:hypothetical protein